MGREPEDRNPTRKPPPVPVHVRIRRRREERGIAGYEFAERVGISPSYVSLIEKGAKIPSEEIAVRIARVLEDDEELYRAWARSSRYDDLGDFLSDATRLHRFSTDPRARQRLEKGDDLEEDAEEPPERRREQIRFLNQPEYDASAFRSSPSTRSLFQEEPPAAAARMRAGEETTVEVPVLEEGADPGEAPSRSPQVVSALRVDRALLPPGEPGGVFAYRMSEEGTRRVRGLLDAGDWVVVALRPGQLSSSRIHAVRVGGKIVLSRVLFKGNSLLLLPSEGAGDFEVIDLRSKDDLSSIVAGQVVLSFRTG